MPPRPSWLAAALMLPPVACGSIEAQGVGIRAQGDARVELQGVNIEGATGIEASDQAHITTEAGRITRSGAALAATRATS